MNATQILDEIREANLGYLMLAQSLIRTDRAQALDRLGVSDEVADRIASLTATQMSKLACSNTLLAHCQMGDETVFELITQHAKPAANGGSARPLA